MPIYGMIYTFLGDPNTYFYLLGPDQSGSQAFYGNFIQQSNVVTASFGSFTFNVASSFTNLDPHN